MKAPLSAGAGILAYFSILVCLSRAQPGSLDIAFNPGSGTVGGPVLCMALQTNGQILVGGGFNIFNGASSGGLVRLNKDGSLDPNFGPVMFDGSLEAVALQPDGRILVGGNFSQVNGLVSGSFARLRYDGSVDTGFTNVLPGGGVAAIALQPDGKVLIAGGFSQSGVARLNTNDTLDASFNPGTDFASGGVYGMELQSSGKILVFGNFTAGRGTSPNYLARLNADGSGDTAFEAGVSGSVSCLAVLPQDKLVIGGSFSDVNGYFRSAIARLNADGSVDTSFRPSLNLLAVDAVAVQADGKVLACGGNGASLWNSIARLNTDGSLDVVFDLGTCNRSIACAIAQPDGKTLVGGGFSQFNGTNINGIVRLNGDASAVGSQFLTPSLYFGAYLSGTVSNTYRIEWSSSLNAPSLWTPLSDVTLQANPQFILDTNLPTGQRFYRAVQIAP